MRRPHYGVSKIPNQGNTDIEPPELCAMIRCQTLKYTKEKKALLKNQLLYKYLSTFQDYIYIYNIIN